MSNLIFRIGFIVQILVLISFQELIVQKNYTTTFQFNLKSFPVNTKIYYLVRKNELLFDAFFENMLLRIKSTAKLFAL